MNEELSQLSSSAHGLLEKEAGPAAFRQVRENDGPGFDLSLWSKMAELGWAGLALSEAHGGYDMGARGLVTIGEALGAHLAPTPFAATAVLAAKTLSAAGRTDRLEALVGGSHLYAVPLDLGSRPRGPEVMMLRAGGGFRLKGSLRHVAHFSAAQSLLFWARSSDDATTAFVLPTEGMGSALTVQVDMQRTATLSFDDVEISADAVVGVVDGGEALLAEGLGSARVAVAAELVGLAKAVFQQTLAYLKDRKQFGVPIGSFQALQHRAAHLHTELAIAGAMVRKAAGALDDGESNAEALVSAAKTKAGQVAILTGNEAIQMHGGVGVTDEYDVGLFVKRIRALENTFGDAQFHTDRYAVKSGF